MVVLLLVGGALACVGGPQKPSVEILAPPTGSQVALGEVVEIEYRASDANAVARVDLEVAGQLMDSQNSPVPEGQPTMTGVLTWSADQPGSYTLIVYAYNADRTASDPVGVNVTVGEEGAVPGSTVTISLIMPGATKTAGSTQTVPLADATASTTRPSSSPAPSATRPPAAPTATPTTPPPPPTATQPPPSPTATTELANLWVENYTSVDICEVYFSPPSEDWGPNRLLAGNRIYSGQSALWTIPPGNYDLWALDCAGNGLVVISNQPIYGDWVWEIYQPLPQPPQMSRFIVFSSCAEPIVYLQISAFPGQNLVDVGAMFTGESRIFEVPPGQWSFVARDQWQQMLDGGEALFQEGSEVYFSVCD